MIRNEITGTASEAHIHIDDLGTVKVRTNGEIPVKHGDAVWLTPQPGQAAPLRRPRAGDLTMRLAGKSALVTGRARGIGAACAREGATIAIRDINSSSGRPQAPKMASLGAAYKGGKTQ